MFVCTWVMVAASFVGDPVPDVPVIPALIAILRDPDIETRVYAGTALAALGSEAVNPLIDSLKDNDRNVRSGAAYALAQLGITAMAAKAPLITALKDEDKDVRRQAAYALSRLLAAERERPVTPPLPPEPVFPKETPR